VEQLQQYYDYLKEMEGQSCLADPTNNEQQQAINSTIRSSQNCIPIAMHNVYNCTPVQYPLGDVPFGTTAAIGLNACIAQMACMTRMNVIDCNQQQEQPQQPPVTPSPTNITPWMTGELNRSPLFNPMTNFQKLTWCTTCGFQKCQHDLKFESFGSKCKRSYCAKCMNKKEFHDKGEMGPFCVATGRKFTLTVLTLCGMFQPNNKSTIIVNY
jgi:hypothetical protein